MPPPPPRPPKPVGSKPSKHFVEKREPVSDDEAPPTSLAVEGETEPVPLKGFFECPASSDQGQHCVLSKGYSGTFAQARCARCGESLVSRVRRTTPERHEQTRISGKVQAAERSIGQRAQLVFRACYLFMKATGVRKKVVPRNSFRKAPKLKCGFIDLKGSNL